MAQLSLKKHVTAPPEVVFEVFSNLEQAASRVRGIVSLDILTEGPVGVGTRFRETRVMFKKESTEELEIIAFDPPRSYTVAAKSCGAEFKSVFRFAPNDAGTDVYFDFETKPVSFGAKLMSPLTKLMMGPMKRVMEEDLDDLRDAAEALMMPSE
jgi:carbon monoxide dehydrogenase subunit G